MNEDLKFYLISVIVFLPLMIILVRLIFKKSILAKFGYIIIIVSVIMVISTYFLESNNLPRILGIPIRLITIFIGILAVYKEIKLLQKISHDISKVSDLDLSIKSDIQNIKRKDKLGILSNSANKMCIFRISLNQFFIVILSRTICK
ncbi:MAG: hypothetical protein U9Q83_00850 [Bacteroidota bacterium]|nr:hypothetical protein [Bacteroidota bacterium]